MANEGGKEKTLWCRVGFLSPSPQILTTEELGGIKIVPSGDTVGLILQSASAQACGHKFTRLTAGGISH